jgi:hypothetical protein
MIDLTTIHAINLVDFISKDTPLKKVSAHEYAGACLRCGGTDRFRVNEERGWFCRQCQDEPGSGGHWHDILDYVQWRDGITFKQAYLKLGGKGDITPERLEQVTAERRQAAKERQQKEEIDRQAAIGKLRTSGDWQRYNHHPEAVGRWAERGITAEWVEYYGLGYNPGREFGNGEDRFTAASLTIPYWRWSNADGWEIIGLRHRLFGDVPGGKYRPDVKDLGNHLFYTDPMTRRFFGKILVVEGEIKAIITWAALWDCIGNLTRPDLWVIGIPGKSYKSEWIETLRQADKVFICLDPDAERDAARLAAEVGDKAQVIKLPEKIDDMLLAGSLTIPTFQELLK